VRNLLLASLLLTLSAATAHAASAFQVVPPGSSIQDAIDNALPNGTIVVQGYHKECSTLYANVTGLKLLGSNATLEGLSGTTLTLCADNVTIQGFKFVNGEAHINLNGFTGTKVLKNSFVNSEDDAVSGSGDGISIIGNVFTSNYENIDVESNNYSGKSVAANTPNILVQANVTQGAYYGIYVYSDDAWVIGNTIQDVNFGVGFYVDGQFPRAVGNTVLNACISDAYQGGGPDAAGIVVNNQSSGGSLIQGNFVSGGIVGISYFGTPNGNPTIQFNHVDGSMGLYGESSGIYVHTSQRPGKGIGYGPATVASNTVTDCNGPGVTVYTTLGGVYGNAVSNTWGMLIFGSQIFISGNVVTNSYAVGLYIVGDTNTISSNVVNGAVNGIWLLEGSNNIINNCLVYNCRGAGLENQSDSTIVRRSSFYSLHNPVSTGGAFSQYTGNVPAGTTTGPSAGGTWPTDLVQPALFNGFI